ncbi:hypothetical protein BT69DRAFT_1265063 [Atractiella rhizophila]|nr:hypothetical protein BT69DRAFT_1265063 [Atractiella rhizophila]
MNDSIAGPSAPTSSLLTQALTYALEAKERGNSAIREKQYTAALDAYEEALGDLPEDFGNEKVELQDIQKKLKDVRIILHANKAQGLLKLERYAEAVEECTLSLRDDDTFVKAIHRRAIANSSIGTWSSLVSAQEDYTRLLSLPLSSGRPSDAQIQAKLQALEPLIDAAKARETKEVVGKLKDLGNDILGRFGLSLDNFVMNQKDSDGGYEVKLNG